MYELETKPRFSENIVSILRRLTPFGVGLWALNESWERPDELKRILFAFGIVCVVVGGLLELRRLINRLLPPPWFPRQLWRTVTWLHRRPRISILVMNPPTIVVTQTDLIESCRLAPVIWEDTTRARNNAAILYGNSTITMRQKRNGKQREFVFRPKETGGFLSEMHKPEQRNVIVEFIWTGAPQRPSDAPDFSAPYTLRLKGVTSTIALQEPLTGSLPSTDWTHIPIPVSAPHVSSRRVAGWPA